ncbi:MAG: bifunctional riboflavin kinase/FAD synthetase [Blastochloris sp.]|nr:bifunctional riboflavin kinase/FAD synthetase [Blastochloris sp.]
MFAYQSLSEASQKAEIRELALGFFDGLHLGHREVILGQRTPQDLTHSAVLSFQQHPQSILFKDAPIKLITGLPHKQKILHQWGMRHLILLPFNLELAKTSAETFLQEIGDALPGLTKIRIGQNFRFGNQRQGNPELIQKWAQSLNIEVLIVTSLQQDNQPISSSRIRRLLSERSFDLAQNLLGRPYSILGQVVEGEKLGRQLGFPTLNLSTEDGLLVPHGVYAGKAHCADGKSYIAAINIGQRPTVADQARTTIEAHLLNFSGDLYGQEVELEFIRFIRNEKKFSNVLELQKQLVQDIQSLSS